MSRILFVVRHRVLLLACLAIVALQLLGATSAMAGSSKNGSISWFRDHGIYRPFRADIRSPSMSVMALGASNEFEYQLESGARRIWDITLGHEFPIVAIDKGSGRNLKTNEWRLGLIIPIHWHMVEDFKDDSNPIINTDFRFSIGMVYHRGISKQARWGARVLGLAHESTHLGDEFTIEAVKQTDFARVNVSYEYSQISLLYERDGEQHRSRFQIGSSLVWGTDGFYSPHDDSVVIDESDIQHEPFIGFEWMQQDLDDQRMGWFFSVDVRARVLFDYNRLDATSPEKRAPSVNVKLGLRDQQLEKPGAPRTHIFLRGYYGLNPHGQFRNEDEFWTVGLGLGWEI